MSEGEDPLATLPSIGHQAMSRVLETFKNDVLENQKSFKEDVFQKLDEFDKSINERVTDVMDKKVKARREYFLKWAKIIFPAIPGSFFTWLIMIADGY